MRAGNKICMRRAHTVRIWGLFLLLLSGVGVNGSGPRALPASDSTRWRADHHMHLASAELCRLVGECLNSNHPPSVLASDAVHALDQANISKGVVLSCAYLFGLPSLHLSSTEIAQRTRRENEFTAEEVAKYPARLVGFLSVNPLQNSAIEEIRHWKGGGRLVGLKLHFTASGVDIRSRADRRKLAAVIAEAAAEHLPMVIHIGGGKFDAADAELFIRDVLPHAGESWVQIAHAGGGLPQVDGNNVGVLRAFANHIVQHDPVTSHVIFDLSYVPAPEEDRQAVSDLVREVRRIGIRRFLFGSDFNVLTPLQEIEDLSKAGFTKEEWELLRTGCAPWACS